MYLIAGLGNPGSQYEATRHNAGFQVIDALASHWGAAGFRDKFKGQFAKVMRAGGGDVVLLKPQTFMNLSGESVQPACDYFGVALENLLVVHDELDLPFGTLRIKIGGGLAGHNGLRSISQQCGDNGYLRLRFGVGRPQGGSSGRARVLGPFSSEERAEMPDCIARAVAMVEAVVDQGAKVAMNTFH